MQTKTVGPRRVSFLTFFEDRHNSRFPMAKSFGNKLRRQRRFSRPRRPRHEETVAFENAPAHHLVQLGNANGKSPIPRRFHLFPTNPSVREKACNPPSLMRMVCNPGTEFCPRCFMICNFRTTEFLSANCESQMRPSAIVNSGLSRISSWTYSPTRNVVASQLVR